MYIRRQYIAPYLLLRFAVYSFQILECTYIMWHRPFAQGAQRGTGRRRGADCSSEHVKGKAVPCRLSILKILKDGNDGSNAGHQMTR